ncbi:MAG: hypothetical protein NC231_04260 [Bacillus sp. (in: Bacteria)]|nr:hypothetical protein [Bacillus sp. (in: firmicutes)]MCM1426578.1 hypothetical protein [Eubacterium sp.]
MKKLKVNLITCVIAAALLTGCGMQKEEPENTETYTEKDNLKQAGLGAMSLLYDDSVWTYDEAQGTEASIVFRDANNSVLGISCSKESYYQHPLDMVNTSKQIYSTYAGYEEVEAPTEITVQNESWYEWSYRYQEDGTAMVALQRFYAKNYYAYTISYVAEDKSYESGKKEALKVMNSIVMSVPGNEEAEAKAREFLAGEWDLQGAGYLVMNDDGTYIWYMDSSKNEDNMHKGTYGCDVENSAVGFSEGEGIYFVLFPEVLYVEGTESRTANAKYDYLVSLEQTDDGAYQMINGSTFAYYNMIKQ